MMDNRMVVLQNTQAGTVEIYSPAYNVKRIFPGKGTKQALPFDVVEQLLWD
jgi:hypothetical protein